MSRPRPLVLALAIFVAIAGVATLARYATAPGADIEPSVSRMMGRAPRLDAYWYTRAAVEHARGGEPKGIPSKFDRPGYTAWCRALFAVTGPGERALALPSILAGALCAGLVFLLGRRGGMKVETAALAGLFAATNWIAAIHDREPLLYSLVNVGLLVSLVVWFEGFRARPLFLAGWLLFGATVALLKETILLAAPALALAQVEALGGSRKRRLAAAGAVAAAAILVLVGLRVFEPSVWFGFLGKLKSRTTLFDVATPGDVIAAIAELPRTLAVIGRIPAIGILAVIGVVATALEGPPASRDDAGPIFRRFLAAWLIIGCCVLVFFSYRPTRYVLCLFPAAFLLAAHGAAVLWGAAESLVRRGPRASGAILFLTWWVGLAHLSLYLLAQVIDDVPTLVVRAWFRLGVAAFCAVMVAAWQARSAVEAGRIGRARPFAAALVAFVFITDARAYWMLSGERSWDDLAARRSFEAVVGRGARVRGYVAQYLAFDPRYTPLIDFDIRPSDLKANPSNATHLATLWIPELGYVERILAGSKKPLHTVADLVIGRERWRIYRFEGAEARGYELTPFERARLNDEADRPEEAAAAYRALVAQRGVDPVVLAYAGAAIARVDAAEGKRLLIRSVEEGATPRYGPAYLFLADLLERTGDAQRAEKIRERAQALLQNEMVVGAGRTRVVKKKP